MRICQRVFVFLAKTDKLTKSLQKFAIKIFLPWDGKASVFYTKNSLRFRQTCKRLVCRKPLEKVNQIYMWLHFGKLKLTEKVKSFVFARKKVNGIYHTTGSAKACLTTFLSCRSE